MSRIGRLPIPVPSTVKVQVDGSKVEIDGPKGKLSREFHPNMDITFADSTLRVHRPNDARQNKALHGMTRALLANMVKGVTNGFSKRLVINGVGYRAEQVGASLNLQIGYSHPVVFDAPDGIVLTVERGGRTILVEGIDKALVGETAAQIRAVRKPEPYKGKGIAYEGEVIRRKAGKAGRIGAGVGGAQ